MHSIAGFGRRATVGWILAAAGCVLTVPAAAAPAAPDLSQLSVEARVTKVGLVGKTTRIEVRLRDGDASDYNVTIRYGDGTGMGSGQFAECVAPIPSDALDQTLIFEHKYARRGNFKISVEATTQTCYTPLTGMGKESATAGTQVKIK